MTKSITTVPAGGALTAEEIAVSLKETRSFWVTVPWR
jgi:hypothetical protein